MDRDIHTGNRKPIPVWENWLCKRNAERAELLTTVHAA